MKSTTSKKATLGKPLATYNGRGLTSRREVTVNLYKGEPGQGIIFIVPDIERFGIPGEPLKEGGREFLPATLESVISTTRNTALGKGRNRLCFVEHILCAAALCNVEDIYIEVLGFEMPLENGSCDFWIELFESCGLRRDPPEATIELKEPITITSGRRTVMAIPDDKFSVSYMMDFNHPRVGRIWRTWSPPEDINELARARTFGSLAEHILLGFEEFVVSYTKDDFTMELRFADEPVRHKMLDLIGDLILTGINPLKIKAKFISILGGHQLDVELARRLKKALES